LRWHEQLFSGKGEVFCRRLIALGAKMALFPVAFTDRAWPCVRTETALAKSEA